MAVELTYTAVCRNNQLFIFDGLPANEIQTGRRLQEDISDFSNSIGRYGYCTRYEINDKAMLVAYLKAIETDCKAGVLLPALHFEFHGDKEKGLWIAASGEYITWRELAVLISPLNAATRNNITVVLATCHGFTLRQSVNVKDPCPFHFMIAPNQEVNAGVIYDCILPFYKEVIFSGRLDAAIRLLDSRFQRFIAGEWFYSIIALFFTENLSARSRREIAEEMVSNVVVRAGHENHHLIKHARARAKYHLVNPEAIYLFLERNFFHGQNYIPYEDIKKFVDYQKSIR
jgi:hypothetical protein